MAVRAYYCAICGIKLTPEQARTGRPSIDSLTFYCPSCAEEEGVKCVRDAPPLPASTSGRLPKVADAPPVAAEPLIVARAFPLVTEAPQRTVYVSRPEARAKWALV